MIQSVRYLHDPVSWLVQFHKLQENRAHTSPPNNKTGEKIIREIAHTNTLKYMNTNAHIHAGARSVDKQESWNNKGIHEKSALPTTKHRTRNGKKSKHNRGTLAHEARQPSAFIPEIDFIVIYFDTGRFIHILRPAQLNIHGELFGCVNKKNEQTLARHEHSLRSG